MKSNKTKYLTHRPTHLHLTETLFKSISYLTSLAAILMCAFFLHVREKANNFSRESKDQLGLFRRKRIKIAQEHNKSLRKGIHFPPSPPNQFVFVQMRAKEIVWPSKLPLLWKTCIAIPSGTFTIRKAKSLSCLHLSTLHLHCSGPLKISQILLLMAITTPRPKTRKLNAAGQPTTPEVVSVHSPPDNTVQTEGWLPQT